jgi:hypothetical protein
MCTVTFLLISISLVFYILILTDVLDFLAETVKNAGDGLFVGDASSNGLIED